MNSVIQAPRTLKGLFTGKAYYKALRRRHGAEKRFRFFGLAAVLISLLLLAILLTAISYTGMGAFRQTHIRLDVFLDPAVIPANDIRSGDFLSLVKNSIRDLFPEVTERADRRELADLVSPGAKYLLADMVVDNPELIGQHLTVWVPTDDDVDMFAKGKLVIAGRNNDQAAGASRLSPQQISWIETLQSTGRMAKRFNRTFFTAGDSRSPELAGIRGAIMGSLYTLLVTLALSFPIGVAAALYLEEFAPSNRITDIIEVNINNLAAVPSIVFGLLGLAVFLNFFGLPRSAPLVGGLVLTLMTLPTIIIASRAAIKAVPPSIREGALAVGSSKMQATFFHVLPLALPGILTGSIIGMAHALGETAPLLMIGMVAFIVDVPHGFTDPATVLPVQIFLWADSPERAFLERTAAAILVLLAFLIAMNSVAIFLRRKFERQW